MSQEVLFDDLQSQYGVSLAAMMKITVTDKVCVAGLMMTKDTLRKYLPNLTGKS